MRRRLVDELMREMSTERRPLRQTQLRVVRKRNGYLHRGEPEAEPPIIPLVAAMAATDRMKPGDSVTIDDRTVVIASIYPYMVRDTQGRCYPRGIIGAAVLGAQFPRYWAGTDTENSREN